MTNLMIASTEYGMRPVDERFPSLDALIDAALYDKQHSAERNYNLKDLHAVIEPTFDGTTKGERLRLESPNGRAAFTHYSFGQLARTVGAPASYLRQLPPPLAADCLNHGLQDAPAGTCANLLVRANGGTPIVRAATSDSYGRVWDAPLYDTIRRYFGDGVKTHVNGGGEWQSPPVWPGNPPGGQYRGDRDSFVLRIDGGSIVNDPRGFGAIGQTGGRLNRGIMIRNSEVGHCSVSLDCVLFDAICGNHILWGAVIDRSYKRRHVGVRAIRDTLQELSKLARDFNTRTASQDEAIIRTLTTHELASSKEAVIDELKKLGYSKQDAQDAYTTCEQKDPSLNPRSFWGIAAGTTRNSQDSGHQDDRLQLDQLAALVLKRGAALVTV